VNSKPGIGRTAIAAAFLAALGTSGLAFAVQESEPNTSMATAQRLEIGPDGTAEVTGAIGDRGIGDRECTGLGLVVVGDVDFYAFRGREGDEVMIDIDGGMKPRFSGLRSVDTIVAIFGLGGKILADNNDAGSLDDGSVSPFDARIDKVILPATGPYTIGVSSNPRYFLDGGTLGSNTLGRDANGCYTLRISGVTPSMIHIDVKIKPGTPEGGAPINPRSRGNIPVALLSSAEFNAPEVDQPSLRFGAAGNESSLLRCNKDDTDVNADGKPDLVCHFDTQTAAFGPGNVEGIVTGSLKDGRQFEGRGPLKLVPVRR
jgi:hypothetical protein